DGLLKGAKVSRRGPQISHLLFADDCVVFGEANGRGAQVLNKVFMEYENSSVGKGDKISIVDDAWIPVVENYSIHGVIRNRDVTKLDAKRILRIPLALVEHDDLVVWRGELLMSTRLRKIRIGLPGCFKDPRAINANSFVARYGNSNGEVLTLQATLEKEITSLFAAEACACTRAVKLGIQMGVRRIEIDGDALTIIKKCQSNSVDKSEIRAYIKDTK
ncbi:hypothetical protein Golob_013342, partial [Gossypium lobatum]|nr:hypothetical protein [Gossypium lobatum]